MKRLVGKYAEARVLNSSVSTGFVGRYYVETLENVILLLTLACLSKSLILY